MRLATHNHVLAFRTSKHVSHQSFILGKQEVLEKYIPAVIIHTVNPVFYIQFEQMH